MMSLRSLLCCSLLAILSGTIALRAQTPGWALYADGGDVISMVDAGSVLWLGTGGGGLVRFDKTTHQKTTYTKQNSPIPDNWIQSMALDSTGRLWIGTRGGIVLRDGSTWRVFDTTATGNAFPSVQSIATGRNGEIWAVAGGEVVSLDASMSTFDVSNWVFYHAQDFTFPVTLCTCLAVAPDGTVWVGTNEHGVVHSSDSGWVVMDNTDYVSTIDIGPQGDVWMSSSIRGYVLRIDGDSTISYPLSEPLSLYFGQIFSIRAPGRGRVLIGTGDGLAVLDGDSIRPWSIPRPHHPVFSILPGSGDSLWIGSDDGATLYDGSTWATYETSETGLPTNSITAALVDDDIWFGTREGAVRFDGEEWTSYTSGNSGLLQGEVTSLVRDSSGNIWAATFAGLSRFDGTEWHGIPRNDIYGDVGLGPRSLAVAPDGVLWIAGLGLAKYDGATFTVYTPGNSALPNINTTVVVVDDRGGIWIGSSVVSVGLTRFYQGTWTTYMAGKSELPYDRIEALAPDGRGGVWIGSAGIARCDGTTWSDFYNSSNSMMRSMEIHAMTIDPSGRLWFATNDGLFSFDGERWGRFTTRNSGLPELPISGLTSDAAGNIWVSTRNGGVVRYDARVTVGVEPRTASADGPALSALDAVPNPVNGSGMVIFSSANTSYACLTLVDPLGHVVSRLLDRRVEAGPCSVPFETSGLAAGTYFLRLDVDGRTTTRSVVVEH